MAKLDQIIHDIHNELGADMLFIDVVGTDGLSIAAERTQNLDTAAIAARFSLVEKLAIKDRKSVV
jgi:predicted regulator of Ras-like GTPase activity (Roadblock/LC7/MglB family)